MLRKDAQIARFYKRAIPQDFQINYYISLEWALNLHLQIECPYTVLKEIKEKSRRLKRPKGFSIRHVLIHVNGVSEGLEQDEFISNIVNFGTFLDTAV